MTRGTRTLWAARWPYNSVGRVLESSLVVEKLIGQALGSSLVEEELVGPVLGSLLLADKSMG